MNDVDVKVLAGKVAVVSGGGEGLGRDVALLLAARGVALVVAGPDEKKLGEAVGEIVFGGGKARHVVVADEGGQGAAVGRAREVFGGLDLVVGPPHEEGALRAAGGEGVAFVPVVGDDATLVVLTAAQALGRP